MTNPAAADAWWKALSSSAGKAVTYRRGAASVGLTAVVGQTRVETEAGDGATVISRVRDFIIQASDLILDGKAVEPEAGDEIEELWQDQTLVFQVLALGGDAFQWVGQMPGFYRIHAKHIDTREAEA